MKKFFVPIIAALFFTTPLSAYSNNSQENQPITIKNHLISIQIPAEYKHTYKSKKEKDKIEIYHKASKKAGFGGFVFGIKAYKNPKDHATLPGSKKIGELTDRRGRLYDIVIKYPTDVQHDYTKSNEPPIEYKRLYNLGENINIVGIHGAKYYKNQGMKGEDLYKEILKKHITAINEKWNSIKLEKENMSYMYNIIQTNNKKPLDKIGYIYYDINADGIDELIIGEITDSEWKGIIYDIYTMVDREPKHVLSGGARNRFYITDNNFIINEYSSGAGESGVRIYILIENSTEIYPQVAFKYDIYKNKNKPWFLSYGNFINENEWENINEEMYNERKKVFEKYNRFEYIPLSKIK